ncbi:MAG: AarF/UbiB family protein, partial [Gammaproteobacteria bacterium]|nr:AarF/UbiB family protein [Gammaproteobacteria bacterium]
LISALNTWFSSLTECQFFHADLHAGNLMVLTDGRVGFIDFGIVGHIRKETWGALVKFIEAQQTMDFQVMADSMVKIGATDGDVDTAQLAADLRRVVGALDGMDAPDMMNGFVDEHQINELMFSIVETGKKYGIKFPREFALLVKQFLYFDRYVELMAPDMEMFGDDRINLLGGI